MQEYESTFVITIRSNQPLGVGAVKERLQRSYKVTEIARTSMVAVPSFSKVVSSADFAGDRETVTHHPVVI